MAEIEQFEVNWQKVKDVGNQIGAIFEQADLNKVEAGILLLMLARGGKSEAARADSAAGPVQ